MGGYVTLDLEDMKLWARCIWLRIEFSERSYEHCNEPLGSVKHNLLIRRGTPGFPRESAQGG